MKQVKWFDRTFDFSSNQNIFPSIIERLEGTILRIEHKAIHIPNNLLTATMDEKWSIQENIGHLIDLEPIWQGRLDDILNGKEYLRSADLTNKKTDLALHNNKEINSLLKEFRAIREATVKKLKSLDETSIFNYALHPRLKTPMRTIDLFLFVAEHDDHHLARMSEIMNYLNKR